VKGALPAALADLEHTDSIRRSHIAEALQYRPSASSQVDSANV
jgi:magnesium chelatase family protein